MITVADYTSIFSVTCSFRNSNMLILCSRNINYYFQCWKQFFPFFPLKVPLVPFPQKNSMMN